MHSVCLSKLLYVSRSRWSQWRSLFVRLLHKFHSQVEVVCPTFRLINRPTGMQETLTRNYCNAKFVHVSIYNSSLPHKESLEFLLTKWFDRPLLLPASRFMCLSLPICLSASLHMAKGLYHQKTRHPCRHRVNKITYYVSKGNLHQND